MAKSKTPPEPAPTPEFDPPLVSTDPAHQAIEVLEVPSLDPQQTLGAHLLKAQKAIRAVGKGSENAYHKYMYTSSEDMIAAARDALHAGDLTVSVLRFEFMVREDNLIMTESVYRVQHASGAYRDDSFSLPAVVDKGRPMDKAILGAQTTSMNYYLRNLLLIPRVDDNEIDKRDDREHVPERPPFKPSVPRPLGAEDEAALLKALEQRGLGMPALKTHLRSLDYDQAILTNSPAAWPITWKPAIKDWLDAQPPRPK